jgi:hypothetical protein
MGSLGFEVGDSVRVKEGVTDPDSALNIGGWQGRISEIGEGPDGEPFVVVTWDSHTFRDMPEWYLEQSETESLDWKRFVLRSEDLRHARSRDSQGEVDEAAEEIESRVYWFSLGAEGKRIREVLSDVEGEMEELEAWQRYLKENLSFPFEARVSEYQEKGRLRQGDRVKVGEISVVDDLYGVIVSGKVGGESIDFPLCDLEAVNHGVNAQIVSDYGVWFANR